MASTASSAARSTAERARACSATSPAGDASPGRKQPGGHDQGRAGDHGRQRRQLPLGVQRFEALPEAPLQLVGPLARVGRVHPTAGKPAGQFAFPELVRAMIPVADLRLEPGSHGRGRALDTIDGPAPHLLQVGPGELDPVADRGVLQVGTDPSAVDHGCQKRDLLGAGGPEVEVGRPSGGAAGCPRGRRRRTRTAWIRPAGRRPGRPGRRRPRARGRPARAVPVPDRARRSAPRPA